MISIRRSRGNRRRCAIHRSRAAACCPHRARIFRTRSTNRPPRRAARRAAPALRAARRGRSEKAGSSRNDRDSRSPCRAGTCRMHSSLDFVDLRAGPGAVTNTGGIADDDRHDTLECTRDHDGRPPHQLRRISLPERAAAADASRPSGHGCIAVRFRRGRCRTGPRAGNRLRVRRQPDSARGKLSGFDLCRHRPVRRANRPRCGRNRSAGIAQYPPAGDGRHGLRRSARRLRLHHRARHLFVGARAGAGQDPRALRIAAGCQRHRVRQL